eukprot:116202-Hanusia_phi.AAC.1
MFANKGFLHRSSASSVKNTAALLGRARAAQFPTVRLNFSLAVVCRHHVAQPGGMRPVVLMMLAAAMAGGAGEGGRGGGRGDEGAGARVAARVI